MKLVRLIKICLNKTCGKVDVGRLLADTFPIQNGLKQRCFDTITFQCYSKYTMRKAEVQEGLELNGRHGL